MTDSLTNEYHAALIKVHDIAQNGRRDATAWRDVLETVANALARDRESRHQPAA